MADRLRNLGVLMCMGLDWSRQAQAISQSIHRYCHLVEQYRLSVSQAVAFLNGYLLPKLEYGLRYVQCSAQQLQQWDKRVVQCVCRAARMARRMGVAAAACITGVLLPSQLHTVSSVSEAFLRLNSQSEWGELARMQWQSGIGNGLVVASKSQSNRLVQVYARAKSVGWTMQPVRKPRGGWSSWPAVPPGATSAQVCVQQVMRPVLLDLVSGSWGTAQPAQCVRVLTDGSYLARAAAALLWVVGCGSTSSCSPTAPLFSWVPSGLPLSNSDLVSGMRTCIAQLGLPPGDYAGHSFRKGGATSLAAAGTPHHLIQALGRWSSDCYRLYIDMPIDSIAAAARRM